MEVNFVFQVRSFHRLKRQIHLSANAQALWLELFGMFNEKRFPDSLPVSTTHLAATLDISKDGVIRARKQLIDAGLIEEVGVRSGRQHTTYRMRYFITDQDQNRNHNDHNHVDNPVENHGDHSTKSSDNETIDANIDDKCDAKHDTNFESQIKTQNALHDHVCDAYIDDKCDTYINYKPYGKPKRTSQKNTYKLCFNDGWRTDARARAAVAQNVIDACCGNGVVMDDRTNELLCRYMSYGMTPEQEMDALSSRGGKAIDLLNESAYRLGIYSMAQDAGILDVDADIMYMNGGEYDVAKAYQESRKRNDRRRGILRMAGLERIRPTDKDFFDICEEIDRRMDIGMPDARIAEELMEYARKGA